MTEYPRLLRTRLRLLRWLVNGAHNVGSALYKAAMLGYGVASWGMDRHFYLWTGRHIGESDDPFLYMTADEKARMN